MGAVNLGQKPKDTAGGNPAPAQAAIPFTRAARMKSNLAFQTNAVVLGAATVPQSPVQVPAAGYLRALELLVTITSTGNAAAVALAADAPWSILNQVSLVNSAGDNIITPVSGYQLYLMNKYGVFIVNSPYNDPRRDPAFVALTTGAGATAGSGAFRLFIPIEIDPSQAFCALPNLAANKSYLVQFQFNPLLSTFTVAPGGVVSATIQILAHYWSQPAAANAAGVPQQTAPTGVGSVSLWQVEQAQVSAGDRIIPSHNVGNVLRELIFVLRTAAGARTAVDWPALSQILLNNDLLFYLPTASWQAQMANSFGFNTGALDAAGGLDTGVFVLHQFLNLGDGEVVPSGPRDQYLPTLDSTLLQYRGTSFGAAAVTLEILTNSVKPISAAALYEPHVR